MLSATANVRASAVLLLAMGWMSIAIGQEAATPNATMDAIERQLETGRHRSLIDRIAENSTTMTEFTTDGCSGGLSVGWEYLSSQFPEIRTRHGDRPPWEDCCVAHDRHYHAGGADSISAAQSFDQRKAADLELMSCVVETGVERSADLKEEYDLTDNQVTVLYQAIAELMYRAVRLGGVPCTNQPWRWGYGWPRCG